MQLHNKKKNGDTALLTKSYSALIKNIYIFSEMFEPSTPGSGIWVEEWQTVPLKITTITIIITTTNNIKALSMISIG